MSPNVRHLFPATCISSLSILFMFITRDQIQNNNIRLSWSLFFLVAFVLYGIGDPKNLISGKRWILTNHMAYRGLYGLKYHKRISAEGICWGIIMLQLLTPNIIADISGRSTFFLSAGLRAILLCYSFQVTQLLFASFSLENLIRLDLAVGHSCHQRIDNCTLEENECDSILDIQHYMQKSWTSAIGLMVFGSFVMYQWIRVSGIVCMTASTLGVIVFFFNTFISLCVFLGDNLILSLLLLCFSSDFSPDGRKRKEDRWDFFFAKKLKYLVLMFVAMALIFVFLVLYFSFF